MSIKNIIWLLGLMTLVNSSSYAQNFTPDASIWEDSWTSCNMSPNPISGYGSSHWIQYDLGAVRRLSKTWVWNANEPSKLTQGFKQVKVDYSLDGRNWTHWGEMEFPKGTGEAVYGGFSGPDMVDIEARYVVLTVVSTHGDPSCAGIAEIKFNLLPAKIGYPEYDNYACKDFAENINHVVEGNAATINWTPAGNRDLYLISYKIVGGGPAQLTYSEGPSLTLNELLPNTEYEYFIGVECIEDEAFEWSEVQFFNTALTTSTQNPLSAQNDVVRLAPNPSDGNFEVALITDVAEEIQLTVLDVQGRTVYRTKTRLKTGPNVIPIQLSRQPSGVYFLHTLGELTQKKHAIKLVLAPPN